jgi:hypothetical protein
MTSMENPINFKEFYEAVRRLYYAGHWTCYFLSHQKQVELWEAVKVAGGFEEPSHEKYGER